MEAYEIVANLLNNFKNSWVSFINTMKTKLMTTYASAVLLTPWRCIGIADLNKTYHQQFGRVRPISWLSRSPEFTSPAFLLQHTLSSPLRFSYNKQA